MPIRVSLPAARFPACFAWRQRREKRERGVVGICKRGGGGARGGSTTEAFRKKRKVGWNSENSPLPLNVNVFLCRFFLISPSLWPNSGYWCCTFLISCLMSLKFWHLEIIQLLPNLKSTTILLNYMGCRISGISYSLKQNDTQTKVFEKFWSIKG